MTLVRWLLVGWLAGVAAVAALTGIALASYKIAGRRAERHDGRARRERLGGAVTPNTSPVWRHPAEPPATPIWYCPFIRSYYSEPCVGHGATHTDVNVDDFLTLADLDAADLGYDLARIRQRAGQ